MGILLAVTMLLAGTPYTAVAADVVEDTDGTAYAQDARRFVYQVPKGQQPKKAVLIYMYTGSKTSVSRKNVMLYTVTGIGTDLSQLILDKSLNGKDSVRYTTIENLAFKQTTAVPDRDPASKC